MARRKSKQKRLVLRLYIAGSAPNSVLALANARAICAEHFSTTHDLEIIDLLQYPLLALKDSIIVTPTLLKLLPLPAVRLIGNLSDTDRVVFSLGTT